MWAIDNRTPYAADRTWIRDAEGAEVWIVAVKATYDVLPDGSTRISSKQVPVNSGPMPHPGLKSLLYDTDLGPPKTATDIVLAGHAYSQDGLPVTELPVGFRVGALSRAARVFGNRSWQRSLLGTVASKPEPFTRMPLVYERAFGGDDIESKRFSGNPLGRGIKTEADDRIWLPNIESIESPIRNPGSFPPVVGFGPIPSHWPRRRQYAGMAIVVGVESCFSSEAMMWLEYQFLLHGARQPHRGKSRVNPYGRVPGEGAAAIALTGRQQLDAPPAWASLLGVGLAEEPVTYDTPEPCIGMGLALAARRALEQAGKHTKALVGNITVDLNGEPYRADEFGFVALRLGKRLASDWQRHAPALVSGDLNSASAITHVALAAYAMHVRPQPAQHLVLASSDDPQRGAVLLGAAQPVPTPIEVRPWRSPSTSTA